MPRPADTEPGPWPHLGAVLAGGGSRRMGRTKALLPLPDGRPMAQAVAETLAQVCRDVVIVGPAEPVATLARWRHLPDARPGLGPLGGIEALLASGLDTAFLVCPCDVPLVSAGLLRGLTATGGRPASVFSLPGEGPCPLPIRIEAGCRPAVERLLAEGRRAVCELLAVLAVHTVEVPESRARELVNVNTPQDYAALRPTV